MTEGMFMDLSSRTRVHDLSPEEKDKYSDLFLSI